jgi:hypothetical protein
MQKLSKLSRSMTVDGMSKFNDRHCVVEATVIVGDGEKVLGSE